MPHELREHPRFQHQQPILITVGGDEAIGETRDLSFGGLFISIESAAMELHEEVQISLRIGAGGEQGVYTGQVVHLRRENDGQVVGAGLSLIKTSKDDRLAWIRHIHYIEQHAGAKVV